MKKLVFVFLVAMFMSACTQSEETPSYEKPANEEEIFDENNHQQNEQHIDEVQLAVAEYATYYFARLQSKWDDDNGEMWGVPLHTPLVIVCTDTSTAVANRPDSQGQFIRHYVDDTAVYIGSLSTHLPRMERRMWGGQMGVFFPLEQMQSFDWFGASGIVGISERNMAHIMHYVMHALQPQIMNVHGTSQVPSGRGRVYYHLEMGALVYAITADEREQTITAIHDALSFRHIRRSAYGTGVAENQFKIVEGTAVYTELSIVFDRYEINDIASQWLSSLILQPDDRQVAMLYGYYAGALYGILMDDFGIDWRPYVGLNIDLGHMLQEALGITELLPFDEIDVERYGYSESASQFR
ncbi:MAG: hypothetical protein FWD97_10470 [Defluviitaleaceae bacterium]|nr:hypothetical protein [Defluviitaleaceae bacterium]